jgi:tRNA pseudouridine38-40 synthase
LKDSPQSVEIEAAREAKVRVKIVVAFDGTAYSGWQVQKIGRGVQEVIETALHKIFGVFLRIHGSSRTDTGVHALGMVAHFDVPKQRLRMPVQKLALAINANLPPDIRVMEARRVTADFHARFDARGKQYRYYVWNHPSHQPLSRQQTWHVPKALDLGAMQNAAKLFVGRHDFISFAGTRSYEMESTIRTVTRCELKRKGPLLTFYIEGDGFLYKMCRGIVGTVVQIGQGKFGSDAVLQMLAHKDRRAAGMTAPAHGLVLWKVYYKARRKR